MTFTFAAGIRPSESWSGDNVLPDTWLARQPLHRLQ